MKNTRKLEIYNLSVIVLLVVVAGFLARFRLQSIDFRVCFQSMFLLNTHLSSYQPDHAGKALNISSVSAAMLLICLLVSRSSLQKINIQFDLLSTPLHMHLKCGTIWLSLYYALHLFSKCNLFILQANVFPTVVVMILILNILAFYELCMFFCMVLLFL